MSWVDGATAESKGSSKAIICEGPATVEGCTDGKMKGREMVGVGAITGSTWHGAGVWEMISTAVFGGDCQNAELVFSA